MNDIPFMDIFPWNPFPYNFLDLGEVNYLQSLDAMAFRGLTDPQEIMRAINHEFLHHILLYFINEQTAAKLDTVAVWNFMPKEVGGGV
jgi:hypothetical protein